MMNGAKDSAIAIGEAYYDMMEEMGLNDLEGTDATSGGFQSMSQDTADELNARFLALQMEGANVVAATNIMLDAVANIQTNADKQVNILSSLRSFAEIAYQQAEERIDVIRAINDKISSIMEHTSNLRQIRLSTDKL